MASPKLGDSTKIVSVTPKFYIKDDGTDYTTGEDYNGLWSTGTNSGYGGIGHWKLNESDGNIFYNNRNRGQNDLYFQGHTRSTDAIGTYVQFALPGNLPLKTPSSAYYCMLGASVAKDTGTIVQSTQFDQWLTSPGTAGGSGGATGLKNETHHFTGKIMFDFWAYFRKGPTSASDYQTYLQLVNKDSSSGNDTVLRFYMFNLSGTPELRVAFADNVAASRGGLNDYAGSQSAAGAIYPDGFAKEGGLHHVALVFDKSNFSNFGTANGPDGFYVDGEYHACNATSGISSWYTGDSLEVNVNPILFTQIYHDNPTWNATRTTGEPRFNKHFTGKVYQVSMTPIDSAGECSSIRMKTLNALKFDIPRGPSKVDFSDRYEYKGQNLLQNMGAIKQAIETDKGTFVISVSQVKAKN